MVKNGPISGNVICQKFCQAFTPVDGRGLIDFVVDGLQTRQVQQRGVGHTLPDGQEHDREPCQIRIGDHGRGQPIDVQRLAEGRQRGP